MQKTSALDRRTAPFSVLWPRYIATTSAQKIRPAGICEDQLVPLIRGAQHHLRHRTHDGGGGAAVGAARQWQQEAGSAAAKTESCVGTDQADCGRIEGQILG